jgi:ubiquinone/menaquinone biosynthesis C-methylase UbiE
MLLTSEEALILGDGDGRFTKALLRHNPVVQGDIVDSSPKMLELLRVRTRASASRIRLHAMDALRFRAACKYDLVVTHFFLDCLSQEKVQILIEEVSDMMRPNALWLISEFHIPDGAMRPFAQALLRTLYCIFRILTGLRTSQLPDYATALKLGGFTRIALYRSHSGLLSSELWRFG